MKKRREMWAAGPHRLYSILWLYWRYGNAIVKTVRPGDHLKLGPVRPKLTTPYNYHSIVYKDIMWVHVLTVFGQHPAGVLHEVCVHLLANCCCFQGNECISRRNTRWIFVNIFYVPIRWFSRFTNRPGSKITRFAFCSFRSCLHVLETTNRRVHQARIHSVHKHNTKSNLWSEYTAEPFIFTCWYFPIGLGVVVVCAVVLFNVILLLLVFFFLIVQYPCLCIMLS